MSDMQLNLMPQSKVDAVKLSRRRNLIVSAAFLASGVCLGIFLLTLFSVDIIQKHQLDSADKAITDATAEIKKDTALEKILTVQNQLTQLSKLHQAKHISSRLFTYLPQVTPPTVHIGHVGIDYATNSMDISGTADSPHSVNTFIDTLKFTNFTIPGQTTAKSAFPSVIENSFSVGSGNVSYALSVHFDPTLFANTVVDSDGKPASPKLVVPSQTTTRSVLNDPANSIFNGQNTGDKAQ